MTAFMPFALTIAVIAALGLWAPHGLHATESALASIAAFCRSIADGCVEYSAAIRLALLGAGSAIIFGAILYGAVRGALRLGASYKMVGRLPKGREGAITVIEDRETKAAFTHGLLKPRIYISRGLIDCLDRKELRAVLLHERHHQKSRHPLRFLTYSFIKEAFFWAPALGHAIDRIMTDFEFEADRAAVGRSGNPVSLASAIVKAAKRQSPAAAASVAGSGADIGARVRRLVNGEEPVRKNPGLKKVALSLFSFALITTALLLPLSSSAATPVKCSTDHCAVHIDKLGKECKTHCETNHHHRHHG